MSGLRAMGIVLLVFAGSCAFVSALPYASAATWTNESFGTAFHYSWDGAKDYSTTVNWSFNISLGNNLTSPGVIVSVPYWFLANPYDSQYGPTLHDTIYFNGQLAEWTNNNDTSGATTSSPGSEWNAYAEPHIPPAAPPSNESSLHAGANRITVLSVVTFQHQQDPPRRAPFGRAGIFNVTLGPPVVTIVTSAARSVPSAYGSTAPSILVTAMVAATLRMRTMVVTS